MRELFAPEEMRDRYRFTYFLHSNFIVREDDTEDFREPLSVEKIYQMFSYFNPETTLTSADVENILIMSGCLTRQGVWLDLRSKKAVITDLLPQLKFLLKPESEASRQNMSRITMDPIANEALRFCALFGHKTTPASGLRTSVNRFYNLYLEYCGSRSVIALSKKRFLNVIEGQLGTTKKGYVNKVSGVTYLDVAIPPDELWSASIQFGLGIFPKHVYSPDGKTLMPEKSSFVDVLGKILHLKVQNGVVTVMDMATEVYIKGRREQSALRAVKSRTEEEVAEAAESRTEETAEAGASAEFFGEDSIGESEGYETGEELEEEVEDFYGYPDSDTEENGDN